MVGQRKKNRRFCLVPTYRGIDKPPFSFLLSAQRASLSTYLSYLQYCIVHTSTAEKLGSVICQNKMEYWSDLFFFFDPSPFCLVFRRLSRSLFSL